MDGYTTVAATANLILQRLERYLPYFFVLYCNLGRTVIRSKYAPLYTEETRLSLRLDTSQASL